MLDVNFYVVAGFVIAVIFVAVLIAFWWMRKEVDPVKRAFNGFTLMILASAISIIFLWLSLPSASVLSTLQYPDAEQVRSFDDVRKYLQVYNQALVRTIRVLHLFLVLFVWWFLASLYWFSRMIVINIKKN